MKSFLVHRFLINWNAISIYRACFICQTINYVILLSKFAEGKSLNKWHTRDINKWTLLLFQRLLNQHIPLRNILMSILLYSSQEKQWEAYFFSLLLHFHLHFFLHSVFPLNYPQLCSAPGVHFTSTRRGILDQSCSIWVKSYKKLIRLFRGQHTAYALSSQLEQVCFLWPLLWRLS